MKSKNTLLKYHIGDKKIVFHEPLVMGILNMTPDSFYDGGRYNQNKNPEKQIENMITEGTDLIDIGAVSTRPGAKDVSEKEELHRLIPALTFLRKKYPNTLVSIDTYRSSVVDHVIKYFGPVIVNDVSGGQFDKKMAVTIANHNVPYILMHMQGTPQTMQKKPSYNNIIKDIKDFFQARLTIFLQTGVKQLIIDPGFGFGKTLEQNFVLLSTSAFSSFLSFGYPLLVGISRKSMVYKSLQVTPNNALNGSTALHMLSLLNGANILRVHDVKAAIEVKKLFLTYRKAQFA